VITKRKKKERKTMTVVAREQWLTYLTLRQRMRERRRISQ
jgi:hypothetical protein